MAHFIEPIHCRDCVVAEGEGAGLQLRRVVLGRVGCCSQDVGWRWATVGKEELALLWARVHYRVVSSRV